MTAGGAVGQLARLLALIPWLLQRPGVSITAAAKEFGITEAQLRADLGLAFFCGLPGHMPDDLIEVSLEDDRIVVTNADTIARPAAAGPRRGGRPACRAPGPGGRAVARRTRHSRPGHRQAGAGCWRRR